MDVDPKLVQQAQKLFQNIQKHIQEYFAELNTKKNLGYMNYFEGYAVQPPDKGQVTIQLPVKNDYIDIPIEYNTPLAATLKFQGIHTKEVYIMVNIPPVLFGPRNLMPQIMFLSPSPVSYPGNIGLVWEPLTKSPGKFGFHPFSSPQTMRDDLTKYYTEGVVDQFSDILNRWELDESLKIREFITETIKGRYGESFKRIIDKNQPPASILIPIMVEHDEQTKSTSFQTRFWASQNEWIPAAEIIMKVLNPLAAIATMFNEAGELDKEVPLGLNLEAQEQLIQKDRRTLSMKDKEKELRIGNDDNLFGGTLNQKKRDEFGYIIGEDVGKKDTITARQTVIDQKARIEEFTMSKTNTSAPTTNHVKKYNSAAEWFEACQGKKYLAKGDISGLSFLEKSNVSLILGLSQPFILRYARDQIRLKMNSTSAKAIEILFAVYNKGFLFDA